MIYRFAEFELDEDRFQLSRGLQVLRLQHKSFEILRYLLRNAERVVSKKELFAEFWPDSEVMGSVLAVHIYSIRRALGSEGSDRLLQTVPGKGYAIACPVRRADSSLLTLSRLAQPTFVGHQSLIRELGTELERVSQEHNPVFLIHGQQGAGKTRLLGELALRAERSGAIVAQVRGEHGATTSSPEAILGGLLAAARHQFEERSAAESARSASVDAPQGDMLRLLAHAVVGPGATSAAQFERAAFAIRAGRALTALAPLVWIVDDLDAVDPESLQVLALVLRELGGNRLLLIAACRKGAEKTRGELRQWLGLLATDPGIRHFALGGLDEEAAEALVRENLASGASRSLIRSLFQWTEGIPFYLLEFARDLSAQSSESTASEPAIPLAVVQAVGHMLAALSVPCRHALEWASVIGGQFSVHLLAAASAAPADALLALLAEAYSAGVIEASDGSGPPGTAYQFAHRLYREVLYQGIDAPERAVRHRAVGDVLLGLGSEEGEAGLGQLANHFYGALALGQVERALDYCLRAGRAAAARGHNEEAVRHLEHARRAETLLTVRDPLRECSLALRLGAALHCAGHRQSSRAAFFRAAELARQLGRPDLIAWSAVGLGQWPRFSRVLIISPIDRLREPVLSLAEEALRGLEKQEPGLRARVEAVRARALLTRPNGSTGTETDCDSIVAVARACGDRRALFDALLAQRLRLQRPDQVQDASRVARELTVLADELGSPWRKFAACEASFGLYLMLGDMAAADQVLETAAALARLLNASLYDYAVDRFRLARVIGSAKFQEARNLLTKVLAGAREVGDLGARWAYNVTEVWLRSVEGRPSVSERIDTFSSVDFQPPAVGEAMRAHYEVSRGNRAAARDAFRKASARGFMDLEVNDDWLWFVCVCADVAARLHDQRSAEELYAMIAPHAELNVMSSVYIYRGSAHHVLGRLAASLGRHSTALVHLEAAMEFNRRIGALPSLALSQYHCGRLLLKGNTNEQLRGRKLARQAAESARRTGLLSLLQRSDWSILGFSPKGP